MNLERLLRHNNGNRYMIRVAKKCPYFGVQTFIAELEWVAISLNAKIYEARSIMIYACNKRIMRT
jgi:hypothetical protein